MKFPALKGTALAKIVIGIVAGIVVVVGGFLLVQNVFTKASDSAPRDLIISDITTNTVKIAWTTDQETQGVVEYGASPTSLNLFSPESQKQKNHVVSITLLSPATSYYFQIRIGETKYDNGGVPWTFATKGQQAGISGSPTPPIASGTPTLILTPGGGITPVAVTPTSSSAFGPLKSSSLKVNPTASVPTATPIISTPTPALTSFYCVETDCQQICLKMRTGQCSTLEWNKSSCTGKVNMVSCFAITPTPTWNPLTPSPTPSNTPTPSPTVSPYPSPTTPGYMQ
jgi:hypothetical protein